MKQKKAPALFVTDWGPMPAYENDAYTTALSKIEIDLPQPTAIIIMSGHWHTNDIVQITSAQDQEIIYDYYGFSEESYKIKYPYKGDPALAHKITELLLKANIPSQQNQKRGLDHGAWVPLYRMYPKANIPIVQISVPAADPKNIYDIGKALAPLRDQNVLIIASGSLIHNLQLALRNKKEIPPEPWAIAFSDWVEQRILKKELNVLFDYRAQAPNAKKAAPTTEHFDPLFFSLGAAGNDASIVLYKDIKYGNGLMIIMKFE